MKMVSIKSFGFGFLFAFYSNYSRILAVTGILSVMARA